MVPVEGLLVLPRAGPKVSHLGSEKAEGGLDLPVLTANQARIVPRNQNQTRPDHKRFGESLIKLAVGHQRRGRAIRTPVVVIPRIRRLTVLPKGMRELVLGFLGKGRSETRIELQYFSSAPRDPRD